jgi:hypothetical protein
VERNCSPSLLGRVSCRCPEGSSFRAPRLYTALAIDLSISPPSPSTHCSVPLRGLPRHKLERRKAARLQLAIRDRELPILRWRSLSPAGKAWSTEPTVNQRRECQVLVNKNQPCVCDAFTLALLLNQGYGGKIIGVMTRGRSPGHFQTSEMGGFCRNAFGRPTGISGHSWLGGSGRMKKRPLVEMPEWKTVVWFSQVGQEHPIPTASNSLRARPWQRSVYRARRSPGVAA